MRTEKLLSEAWIRGFNFKQFNTERWQILCKQLFGRSIFTWNTSTTFVSLGLPRADRPCMAPHPTECMAHCPKYGWSVSNLTANVLLDSTHIKARLQNKTCHIFQNKKSQRQKSATESCFILAAKNTHEC